MILAVDIGNTHMVLGCLDAPDHVLCAFQMSTDRVETPHEYAAEIAQIFSLEKIDVDRIRGSIISSVVPEVRKSVASAIRILTGRKPLLLGEGIRAGIEVEMNGLPADAIAGDLLATAAAAKKFYPLPAVIIDIGTATTVTAVSKEGRYTGGCILPGPDTAMRGMLDRTSLLPAVDYTAPDRVIAKDTVNAMRSGILYGSAGALDGILEHFEEELGEIPSVLVTGGMGRIIAPFCRHDMILDDTLLLKGLALIWEENQETV